MEEVKKYIEENKQRFLDELFGLIRIPSISSISDHKPDMIKAAEYWKKSILEAGADKAVVMPTAGNPVVYGEKIIDPALPTVLVYGHYDVMPVDPLDLWNTDPFEPVIKDDIIWARGADDDKGQAFMHAKAFEALVKTNNLPCNVKFMIEGEEEVGSVNLGKFCDDNKEMLKADVILVSDTGMLAPDMPSITTGLRGLSYWEVEVTGPNRDLHSGLFGGAVANPINVLAKMIADTMDDKGRITIPGFYDDVIEVTADERALMAKAPFDVEEYKKAIDVEELQGEEGFSTMERTGIRPTFDICGIWGGYTGEGAKTVLPSKAYAKISTRLVPNQDNHKISDMFKAYFEGIAPKSVKVKVTPLHGGQGYVCPIDIPAYKAAEKAYMDVYKVQPVPVRSGGSIPIISTFEDKLGLKSVLMGFGLEADAIHSPNENFPLEQFYNGIETLTHFYKHYVEIMK
ncbi:MAG: dipeptidase [Bacteroidetes bacterium]|jgi:acetylornithine deacetylase/succinyl-diaminopimelate desuccinylase-like protein|nr:dipeptidase [Bacteroidota bacterium]MBT5529227.1 dipeptidase [Cytophagia bacterium]MBT3424376.1 dipeptidase [Bacteroidota bacterium]MBT3799949.1 dipeptidase [Bacteroidota bacterium]MBT3932803.1 dipeptidase [Bacteroidota bacterium]